MNNLQDSPLWTRQADLEDWPMQVAVNKILRYSIPIRQGWNIHPLVNQTPMEIEHIFRGIYDCECLTVAFMSGANPEHELRNWVEAILGMMGFPLLALQQNRTILPQLLEWQYQGNCPIYAERLAVDEVHLYEGLAQFPDIPSELARLYILLARRENLAWKVGLSFLSACLPGMSEDLITSSDRVRGGATFSRLRFL
ncbi:MAG: hypothetical protein J7647_19565 [Cyanobacteria bacterium SBLK]|nr:hypothetical protein [Cyanobacteria bacterium SBLK]